jgi:hypothetical protein
MNMYEKLATLLGVAQITDDFRGSPDLQISEWHTADSYDVHVMTNDERNIQFDYDVFYYTPSFNQIIDRIKELNDKDAIVYVSDFETYLPEYEVQDYIDEHEENLLELLNVENYDN